MVRNGNWVGNKPLDVNVTSLSAYYRKGASGIDPQKVNPFPSGLKMVIHDRNNNNTNVKWYCSGLNGEGNNGIYRDRPYDCGTTTPYKYVTARITFPQCGDGRLDSADHIGHMVYAGDNGCPKDHPRVFPRLFIIRGGRAARQIHSKGNPFLASDCRAGLTSLPRRVCYITRLP